MDKNLINTLIGGIVIVSISVAYYLIIFIPDLEKSKVELQRQENIAAAQEKEEAKEQGHKEYVAKRKNDCYAIYEKERKEWNNTIGSTYDEVADVCRVSYKDDGPKKSEEECKHFIENEDGSAIDALSDAPIDQFMWRFYTHCINNTFDKVF